MLKLFLKKAKPAEKPKCIVVIDSNMIAMLNY